MAVSALSYVDKKTGLYLSISNIDIEYNAGVQGSKGSVTISIDGHIRNLNGRVVGNVSRIFYFTRGGKPVRVVHRELSLRGHNKRQGFGRRYLKWAKSQYASLGFKQITTYAAGGRGYNGSYTWARLGFEATNGVHWHRHNPSLTRFIEGLERDVRMGRLSPRLFAEVDEIINGPRRKLSAQKIANLGKRSKYRSRRGNHIGKELLLLSSGWEAYMNLEAA